MVAPGANECAAHVAPQQHATVLMRFHNPHHLQYLTPADLCLQLLPGYDMNPLAVVILPDPGVHHERVRLLAQLVSLIVTKLANEGVALSQRSQMFVNRFNAVITATVAKFEADRVAACGGALPTAA
jgi:hypothetical protein